MKAQAVFGLILLLVLVVAVIGFVYYIDKITKDKECGVDNDCPEIKCVKAPCDVNKCIDNKCKIEPVIEKCSEVSLENLQECCDKWAKEKGVFVIACVGEWEIVDNQCAWKCKTD